MAETVLAVTEAPTPTVGDFIAAIFHDAGDSLLELRALPSTKTTFVVRNDATSLRTFMRRPEHIYFGVASRKDASSGAAENLHELPALFSDLDFKTTTEAATRAALAAFPLAPTAVVHTGGGLHVYFVLDTPADVSTPAARAKIKATLRRLAEVLGGDLASAEPARILRLPGTKNHKYAPPRPVIIEALDAGRRYTLAEIEAALPVVKATSSRQETNPSLAAGAVPEGGRNAFLTSQAGAMQRRGMAHEAIVAALLVENAEKCNPPLDDDEVKGIAQSITRYAPEDGHEPRVLAEMEKERARRDARRRLDAEERPPAPVPEFETLAARLARPRRGVRWRIDGWQGEDSRVMLVAQFKAGKTTLIGNLVRSLVDGDPFLGAAPVAPITGAVATIDFEMSEHQIDDWYRDQRIRATDRVLVVPMRGKAAAFNIIDPAVRAQWAARLKAAGVRYLVLDCLRPVLDGLGLDEHRDAGRFLVPFDALLVEAGIPEAVIVDHMGHTNERARGDSRKRDWPDAEWRLVRQDEQPGSPRYITAYGRDVDIRESLLTYDTSSRRLSLAGGSRKDAKAAAALDDVIAVVKESSIPMSGRAIEAALGDSDHPRAAVKAALKLGVRPGGGLAVAPGERRAMLYTLSSAPVRRSAPSVRQITGANECASAPVPIGHGAQSTDHEGGRVHRV